MASEDITTNFDSGTLDNNINKWPKVGKHDLPPSMISDNFKTAILLYVYYMGYIEIWVRVYVRLVFIILIVCQRFSFVHLQFMLEQFDTPLINKDSVTIKKDISTKGYSEY